MNSAEQDWKMIRNDKDMKSGDGLPSGTWHSPEEKHEVRKRDSNINCVYSRKRMFDAPVKAEFARSTVPCLVCFFRWYRALSL